MIHKKDYKILRAFLQRESRMFNWGITGEKGRKAFVERLFRDITRAGTKGYNYVRIQSITNMGCLDSELALTSQPFEPINGTVIYSLPSSPRHLGSFYEEKQQ